MDQEKKAQSVEKRLVEIEERNKRVEANKAWETSGFRKFIIFIVTYMVAAVWLISIEDINPMLKALVPALGWYLSTLTVPFVKKWWINKYQ